MVGSWINSILLLCLLAFIVVVMVRQDTPVHQYKEIADTYLDKARNIGPASILYQVKTKKEFDDFSLDFFVQQSIIDKKASTYLQKMQDTATGIKTIQKRFEQTNVNHVPERIVQTVKQQTSNEFECILKNNRGLFVVCVYTDESGQQIRKSLYCTGKYLKTLKDSVSGVSASMYGTRDSMPHTESVLSDLEKVTHLHISDA